MKILIRASIKGGPGSGFHGHGGRPGRRGGSAAKGGFVLDAVRFSDKYNKYFSRMINAGTMAVKDRFIDPSSLSVPELNRGFQTHKVLADGLDSGSVEKYRMYLDDVSGRVKGNVEIVNSVGRTIHAGWELLQTDADLVQIVSD